MLAPVGHDTGHPPFIYHYILHLFGGVDRHSVGLDMIGHGGNVTGQSVAAQMLLLDQEQVDAKAFGLFANLFGLGHIRRIDRRVHAETVEDGFGFIDKRLGIGNGHELGKVGFAQLVDKIEFAVGKQPRTTDAAKDIAGPALGAILPVGHRAGSFECAFAPFQKQHFEVCMFTEVIGGKEARGSSTDDNHVITIDLLGLC